MSPDVPVPSAHENGTVCMNGPSLNVRLTDSALTSAHTSARVPECIDHVRLTVPGPFASGGPALLPHAPSANAATKTRTPPGEPEGVRTLRWDPLITPMITGAPGRR